MVPPLSATTTAQDSRGCTSRWAFRRPDTWLLAAVFASLSFVAAVPEPTAELVASYSLAELEVILNFAYAWHGGLGLVGTTLYGVKVYRVSYTPGLAGSATPGASRDLSLTGLLMIPDRPHSQIPVAAFLHGTSTVATDVPSTAFDTCGSSNSAAGSERTYSFPSAFRVKNLTLCLPDTSKAPVAVTGGLVASSMGYVSILPDGVGYGSQRGDTPMSYLVANDYALTTFNLHAAAAALVPKLNSGAGVTPEIITAGYSEGGYGALAVHRASLESSWASTGVRVVASFPSGGPYDLKSTAVTQSLETPESVMRPTYVLFVGFSYWQQLGISGIFDGAYITSIAAWFDGTSDASTIDSTVTAATGYYGGSFVKVFNSSLINELRLDERSKFSEALDSNTLASGWSVGDQSAVHLCHGEADRIVSKSHAERAVGGIDGRVSLMVFKESECSGHNDCAPKCLMWTLQSMFEHEGKWSGALKIDNGISPIVVTAIVVALAVMIGGGFLIHRKCRGRGCNNDQFEMLA